MQKTCVTATADLKEENFETGLWELIGMVKRKDENEAMQAHFSENAERFRNMDDETFDMICTMVNHKLAAKKEKCRTQEREGFDMENAIDEMVKDGEKKGEKQGEKRLGELIGLLLKDGKVEEAANAAKNAKVRSRLYRKYGIL